MDNSFKFKHGIPVKDVITGFEGWIIGSACYITGCNQYLVQPKCKTNDKATQPEGQWLDEDRLELRKGKTFLIDTTGRLPGADVKPPKK